MPEAFFYDAGGGPAFAATGSAQNGAVTAEKTLWLYRDYTLVSGINRAQFKADAGSFRAAYLHELRKQGDKTMWCSVNSIAQPGVGIDTCCYPQAVRGHTAQQLNLPKGVHIGVTRKIPRDTAPFRFSYFDLRDSAQYQALLSFNQNELPDFATPIASAREVRSAGPASFGKIHTHSSGSDRCCNAQEQFRPEQATGEFGINVGGFHAGLITP